MVNLKFIEQLLSIDGRTNAALELSYYLSPTARKWVLAGGSLFTIGSLAYSGYKFAQDKVYWPYLQVKTIRRIPVPCEDYQRRVAEQQVMQRLSELAKSDGVTVLAITGIRG